MERSLSGTRLRSRLSIGALGVILALAVCFGPAGPATAQGLSEFEKRVTLHRLDNGWTFLIYERPGAPVASFMTLVNVGSAQEVAGITGLAHMFEHMAFKGSTRVGTTDYAAEKKALAKIDAAYAAWDRERRKTGGPDEEKLAALETALEDAQKEAKQYVVSEFDETLDREGGVGMNAFTSSDFTGYLVSLPANKAELWAYFEAERFLDPVLREFYTERDVVMEERRLRTDSQPVGRMIEQLLAAAFVAHTYGQPTIGYMSDLQTFTREDAKEFYEKYYVPANMVTAISGGVDADALIPILDRYFGRFEAKPTPEPLRTREPRQIAAREVRIPDPSQPVFAEGYLRPPQTHPDNAVYDAIGDVLSTGRTSRLYRSLVRDQKIAAQIGAFSGFPGSKYDNLMLTYAFPTPGHTAENVRDAIRAEIERLKTEPISDEELAMVKTRAKAGLVRTLASNFGMAQSLATYQTLYGDWRELFRSVERIEAVTKEDILRVAAEAFRPTNRTTAMIVNEGP